MENTLAIADLHLTITPRDEYRWGIFPWLQQQIPALGIKKIYVVGDFTERKDNHPSSLVNRFVDSVVQLTIDYGVEIIFVKGNHDYIDINNPFFGFLRHIPLIKFINDIERIGDELFLPHTKQPEIDWKDLDLNGVKYVFMHQPAKGSKIGKYTLESGMDGNFFTKAVKEQGLKIFSGDIHDPQIVGDVEYIGATYPVDFGDNYQGKGILLPENGQREDLLIPTIARHSLEIKEPEELKELGLQPGDQAKVRLLLSPEDFHDWAKRRKAVKTICKELDVKLCSLEMKKVKQLMRKARIGRVMAKQDKLTSDTDILNKFCEIEGLGDNHLQVGLKLLEN